MLIPEVIGFKLTGKLPEGATATDLVLTVTQMLRKKGVVGKFVEFYGAGLDDLTLADRATIANMAPEYGATCGFFPVDAGDASTTCTTTGRGPAASRWSRPTPRSRACGAAKKSPEPVFTDTLELDLGDVVPSPGRPEAPAGPRAARPRPPASSSPTWRRSSTARTTASASSARAPTTTSATATW